MSISSYRPGVFSSYTVIPGYTGAVEARPVGLAGDFGLSDSLPHSYRRGDTIPEGTLSRAAEVLFAAGLGSFTAVSVAEGAGAAGYTAAFSALAGAGAELLAAEDGSQTVLSAAKTFLESEEENQRELLLFAGEAELSAAKATAAAVNCPRVVLSWGSPIPGGGEEGEPFLGAAALCAAVAAMEEPILSLTGKELPGLTSLESEAGWDEADALLGAGVTPLCRTGTGVAAVRVITTCTSVGGSPNRSFSPVNSILIIDYVMQSLRQNLGAFLQGARNTSRTLSAAASQVTVLLEELLERGIITEYGAPRAYTPGDTPEVCVVEVSFTAAYLINQVRIHAEIRL